MLRSRLNLIASPARTLVSVEAAGYKFLSATAVPARSRLRPSLATGNGPGGVGGPRPASRRPPGLDLSQVPLRWAEPAGVPGCLETPADTAFGTAVSRAPRCLSGGLVQLGSM